MAELKSPYLPPTNYLLKMPHTHTHIYVWNFGLTGLEKTVEAKIQECGKIKGIFRYYKNRKMYHHWQNLQRRYFREKAGDRKKRIYGQEGMKSEDNGKQVDKFNKSS